MKRSKLRLYEMFVFVGCQYENEVDTSHSVYIFEPVDSILNEKTNPTFGCNQQVKLQLKDEKIVFHAVCKAFVYQ